MATNPDLEVFVSTKMHSKYNKIAKKEGRNGLWKSTSNFLDYIYDPIN